MVQIDGKTDVFAPMQGYAEEVAKIASLLRDGSDELTRDRRLIAAVHA